MRFFCLFFCALIIAFAPQPGIGQPANQTTPTETLPSQSVTKKTVQELKDETKKAKDEEHKPADPDTGSSTLSDETLRLLPNPWSAKGIKFSLSYVGETLANSSGGLRQRGIYEGRLNGAVDFDMAKIANVQGLSIHANVFQIHGTGLSRTAIGNIDPVSSIEALATTRLYELWFEQQLSGPKITLRAGQLAADTEFMTTHYADALFNSTFGWPTIFGINMPSGGPSPPLSAVGGRLKAELGNVTLLAGMFDGNASGPGADDPQSRNRYGLNFRVQDSPLVMGEIQYAYNQSKATSGLPGTIKFGAWRNNGLFADQRYAANGLSQASPLASPAAAQLRGDFGLYTALDQLLLAIPGGDGKRGIAMFTRASVSPSDRNLVDLYWDGGIDFLGPLATRSADRLSVAFAYTRISKSARSLDEDFNQTSAGGRPVRNFEMLLTLGYSVEIKPGWSVLPNLQYIIHPGGGYVIDTNGAPRAVGNALVLGLRTVAKF